MPGLRPGRGGRRPPRCGFAADPRRPPFYTTSPAPLKIISIIYSALLKEIFRPGNLLRHGVF